MSRNAPDNGAPVKPPLLVAAAQAPHESLQGRQALPQGAHELLLLLLRWPLLRGDLRMLAFLPDAFRRTYGAFQL